MCLCADVPGHTSFHLLAFTLINHKVVESLLGFVLGSLIGVFWLGLMSSHEPLKAANALSQPYMYI